MRANEVTAALDEVSALRDIIAGKDYAGKRQEFQRDLSGLIQAMQNYADLLGDIVENDFPNADYISEIGQYYG